MKIYIKVNYHDTTWADRVFTFETFSVLLFNVIAPKEIREQHHNEIMGLWEAMAWMILQGIVYMSILIALDYKQCISHRGQDSYDQPGAAVDDTP